MKKLLPFFLLFGILFTVGCGEEFGPIPLNIDEATAPQSVVDPAYLFFPQVDVGQVAEATVTITNEGDARLQVRSIRIVSVDASDHTAFTVPELATSDRQIQPGMSLTVTVSFEPTAVVAYRADLEISTNDPANPEQVVELSNGDPMDLCEASCAKIYETCGDSLYDETNRAMNQSACETRCDQESLFGGAVGCIDSTSCADDPVETCLPDFAVDDSCPGLTTWTAQQESLEDQVLEIVNQHRAVGANCGGQDYGPAPPLVMDPILRCAARLYSQDMSDRGFFDHVDPDGNDPFDRISAAGYEGGYPQGENIAWGSQTASQVMEGWMNSPGHCSNIMERDFREIGIGLYNTYWTQKFGGG